MPDTVTPFEMLPAGCHSPRSEWPWRLALPEARFSALCFETQALCDTNLGAWELALPDRLTTAAAKRRAEFLGGRLTARRALAELTGSPATPAQDPERLPRWPAGTVGSITHSRGLAAAVVAGQEACRGIGLDAEVEMTAERARRLAPQILVASERAWFDDLPGERQGEFLTVAFSLKESLFKALYPLVRRRFYFPHAQVTAWNADEGTVAIELLETLSPEWRAGARLTGQVAKIDDYLLTLIAISRES
jgi:enterobactin synthetase component D